MTAEVGAPQETQEEAYLCSQESPNAAIVVLRAPRGGAVDSPLQTALERFHQFMPSHIRRSYFARLKEALNFHMSDDGALTCGSACSGTDIGVVCLEFLLADISKWLGLPAKVEHAFACEKDTAKQGFLIAEVQPKMLFDNVSCLSQRMAQDLISGNKVYLPSVGLFFAGFSCKSRSSLNPRSAQNKGCVQGQDMDTETGFTYYHIHAYITKYRPAMFMLENVRQIMDKADKDAMSDADWIVEEFRRQNFFVLHFVFDCASFGSPAARSRIYFLGWSLEYTPALQRPLDWSEAESSMSWCSSFYNSFTIEPLPIECFIVFDIQELLSQASMHTSLQLGSQKGAEGRDTKWCSEHCSAFRELGLPWPTELPAASFDAPPAGTHTFKDLSEQSYEFWRGSLPDRAAELAFFLAMKFTFEADSAPQFVDVNSSLSRLCQDAESCPWRTSVSTITGQSRIVVRYRMMGVIVLRPLLGLEGLSLIGWSMNFWISQVRFSDALLLNMAGNAFSGFAALPMLMSLLAGGGVMADLVQLALKDIGKEEVQECSEGGEASESDMGSLSS